MDSDLKFILEWVRPAGSPPEKEFVLWLFSRLQDYGQSPQFDDYGNIWCKNGSKTLFTSHTDTAVRDKPGVVRQTTRLDDAGIVSLAEPDKGGVLGADDGAGIAMMLALIKGGVQGDFVFFREEEVGGVGSSWAAQHLKSELEGYSHAIAFDRRGTTNVITHQGFSRCCSDEFAQALADAVGLAYAPDDSGVFTDTANLTHIIPECTNLSVGYYNEHTSRETLDYGHWTRLRSALMQVDWSELPVVRDPAVVEDLWSPYGDYYPDVGDDGTGLDDEFYIQSVIRSIQADGYQAAEDIVYSDPTLAAALLADAYS